MPEYSREPFTRGVKLTSGHFAGPLQAIESDLEDSSKLLDRDNLGEDPQFRVSPSVPVITNELFPEASNDPIPLTHWCVPFILSPLQEFFDSDGETDNDTPQMVLREVMLSFDQRGEPVALGADSAAHPTLGIDEGDLFEDALDQYQIRLAIVEKTPMIHGGNSPWVPEREVWSAEFSPELLFGQLVSDYNPLVITRINKALDQYKTYAVMLYAPLDGGTDGGYTYHTILSSLTVSLRISHPPVDRDTNAQNMPTDHSGAKTADSIPVDAPKPDSLILQKGNKGIETNLAALDDPLENRLDDGYSRDSKVPPVEHIREDATYNVIIMPFFANMTSLRHIGPEEAVDLPWAGSAPHNGPTGDTRSWPIRTPMTVHHVYAVMNYSNPPDGVHPNSATLEHKVGLGIRPGRQGDHFDYQQVAYVDFTQADRLASPATHVVDRFKAIEDGVLSVDANEPWDFEIIQVPLVTDPSGAGKGYFSQGKPFFVGRSTNRTTARSDVGDGDVADQPYTQGVEAAFEARWTFEDPNGLDLDTAAPAGAGKADETYVGHGGHWLVIIGKAHTTGFDHEQLR